MIRLGTGGGWPRRSSLIVTVPSMTDTIDALRLNPTRWFWFAFVFVVVVTFVAMWAWWRRSAVVTLMVVGFAAILISLFHFFFGSFADAEGLWVNREVLPSVLASLGSSLIAFAGIAWSFQMDQRNRAIGRLNASISEVARAIDHCDQLARRGWRLLDEGLRPLAEPLLERRPPEGGASLWFEVLKQNHEQNRREGSSAEIEVPATPVEVWSALREARKWDNRLVERIESLAIDRARRFHRSGDAWLKEYERLRSNLAGLDDVLPLDLIPFVDDLELVRDTLRASEHPEERLGAPLLLAFAIVLAGLKNMLPEPEGMLATMAERSPGAPREKVGPESMLEPEDMLQKLWRPDEEVQSYSAVDMLGRAAESNTLEPDTRDIVAAVLTPAAKDEGRFFTRHQHWTDVVRPSEGPGSPDEAMRETALKMDFCEDGSGVLFHIVLLMIAPVRREGLLERTKNWKHASLNDLPPDARELLAQIIGDMTGPENKSDEPRLTASGVSLRPSFSELASPLSNPSERNPADLWRLYANRVEWEGLSDSEDPSDVLSGDKYNEDHEPSGWT